MKSDRFLWIQILRGVAALIVTFGHALLEAGKLASQRGGVLHLPFSWGYGVDIFFVISGFIMIHMAARDFGQPGSPGRFLLRRIARIIPLYWFLMVALVAASLVAPAVTSAGKLDTALIFSSALFIPWARSTGEIIPFIPVGWTLNYEMFFYAIFALGMFFPLRRGVGLIAAILIGLITLGALVPLDLAPAKSWTDPLIFEFLFGMMIGLYYRSSLKPSNIVLVCAALAGITLSVANVSVLLPESPRFLTAGLPAAFLIFAGVFSPNAAQYAGLLPLKIIGDASYSLYLSHLFTVRVIRGAWERFIGTSVSEWLYLPAAVTGACLVAIALYRAIEMPMQTVMKNMLARHGAAARVQAI